jgi:DNA-binding CsgD family transcriptional regulator
MKNESPLLTAIASDATEGPVRFPIEAKLSPAAKRLSQREESVLLLAAHGLTDKEIAKHLELSKRTVGTYWERMREKLGRLSRTELVARFVRFDPGSAEPTLNRGLLDSCESSLNFLSENSSDLIARFDSELTCLEVNPSLASIAPPEWIVGKNIRELGELFSPNSAWVRWLTEAFRDAKSVSFRSRFKGIKQELRTSLLPVPTEGGRPTSVISLTALECVKELMAS